MEEQDVPTSGSDWRVVDEALDGALDLDPATLETYLSSLPCDIADRVSGLLAAISEDGPLDRGVASVAGGLLDAADGDLNALPEGRRIGAYRLVRRLGAGGMGVVYLAERADDAYRHRVALKVVRWELADDSLVRRFLDERQILAELSHPNIATLLDGGMTDDGLPYIVLEHIDGLPIDGHCNQNELSSQERVRLMATVCRAVDFAHRQLVVHRDLKPSNILVRPDGVPKLVDFGIAKLLDPAAGVSDNTRRAPLTPRYAAPEQRRGAAITVAVDVWALGMVLAELLAGPASDPADGFGDQGSRWRARLNADPALRGDLANIVSKALSPEPERRYRTAGELADDLDRYLAGVPVEATPPTFTYRLGKLVRRHRAATTAVVLAHVVAIAGLGGIVWQAREAEHERDLARREALQAEQVTAFLQQLFSSSMPRLGGEPRVRDLLDSGAVRIREELRDAPEVRAKLLGTLGSAYKVLHEYDHARELFEEALLVEADLAPGSEGHAIAVAALGGVDLQRGNPEPAAIRFQRALEMMDTAGVGETEGRATVLNSLGMARIAAGDAKGAIAPLKRSAAIYQALDDPVIAMPRANLARALDQLGRHAEAETEHRAALEVYRRVWPTNATIPTILNNLAINLASQGRLDDAIAVIGEAREMRSEIPGDEIALAESDTNLAYLLLVAGRAGEAAELAKSAASVLDARSPGTTSAIAARANLGWALVLDGDTEGGLPILEAVIDELSTRFGAEHPVTARGRTRYGAALHRAGRLADASEQLGIAVRVLTPGAASTISVADAALAWGVLRCDTGAAADGLAAVDAALEAYQGVRGADHWITALARVERVRCLAASEKVWELDAVAKDRRIIARARGEEAWATARVDELLR